MRAYSDDLRRKLLEAHQQGEGSLRQLAAQFRVSLSWAKRVSMRLRATGKMERPPAGPRGPRSKLTPEVRQQLHEWIAKQPDLTLAELQQRLLEDMGIHSSLSRLWEVLRAMGLRLKKSRSTRPNRTRLPARTGAVSGAKKPAGSIRRS